MLEEKGIGRPSTYAPTISTIMDREYVVKEGKALRPTPLGEVVTQLMIDKFPDVVDPAFTAHMEGQLDEVEAGKIYWKDVSAGSTPASPPSWLRPRRIWTVSASRFRRSFPMRCAMCAAARWWSSPAVLDGFWPARLSRVYLHQTVGH